MSMLAEMAVLFTAAGQSSLGATIDAMHQKLSRLTSGTSMGQLGSQFEEVSHHITGTLNPLHLLATAVAAIGAGEGIEAMVSSAAQAEKAAVDLGLLTGSAESAKKMLIELREQFAGTDISADQYKSAARALLEMKQPVENIPGMLKVLGNVSVATGMSMDMMARMLFRSGNSAAGASMLIMRSMPILEALKERYHTTGQEIQKMAREGQISSKVLWETLAAIGGQGGKFGGAIAAQQDTLIGRWAIAKERVETLFRSMGDDIIKAFDLKGASTKIGEFVEWFQHNFGASIKSTIMEAGRLWKSLLGWMGDHKMIVGSVAAIAGAFVGLTIAGAGLHGAMGVLSFAMRPLLAGFDFLRSVASTVVGVFTGIVGAMWDIASSAASAALGVGKLILSLAGTAIATAASLLGSLAVSVASLAGTLLSLGPIGIAIGLFALPLLGSAASSASKGIVAAGTAISDTAVKARSLATAFGSSATSGMESFAGDVKAVFGDIGTAASAVADKIGADVTANFDSVATEIKDSWGVISESLRAGDISNAFKVAVATLQYEWAKFKVYMQESWEELKPVLAAPVTDAATKIVTLITNLRLGWDNLWDRLREALRAFVHKIDEALAAVQEKMSAIQGLAEYFTGTAEQNRAEKQAKADLRAHGINSANMVASATDDQRKQLGMTADESVQNFIKRRGLEAKQKAEGGVSSGPALEASLGAPQTPEQKAKRESDVIASGKSMLSGVLAQFAPTAPAALASNKTTGEEKVKAALAVLDAAKKKAAESPAVVAMHAKDAADAKKKKDADAKFEQAGNVGEKVAFSSITALYDKMAQEVAGGDIQQQQLDTAKDTAKACARIADKLDGGEALHTVVRNIGEAAALC